MITLENSKPILTLVDNDNFNITFIAEPKVSVISLDTDTISVIGLDDTEIQFVKVSDEPPINFVSLTERGEPGLNAFQIAQRNGFTGTEEEWLNSLKEVENSRYDFSIFLQGAIYASEELWNFACVTPFKVVTNLEGSVAKAKTPPLQEFTLFILKNDIQFGKIIFTPQSLYGRFDAVEQTFNDMDVLSLASDSVIDPNLTNVAITIAAYRNIFRG